MGCCSFANGIGTFCLGSNQPEIVIVVPEKVTLAGMEESLGKIKKDSEEPDHFILNLTSGAAEVSAGTAPVRR